MGADLFIRTLFEEHRTQWERRFDRAVARRDRLQRGTAAYDAAQQHVEFCFEKLHERGYFRDPYNDWDVLWKFGLSWWTDVIPLLDDEQRLSVENTKKLLALLAEREPTFETNVSKLSAEDQQSFRKRYPRLQRFLEEAIELDEPIECSL